MVKSAVYLDAPTLIRFGFSPFRQLFAKRGSHDSAGPQHRIRRHAFRHFPATELTPWPSMLVTITPFITFTPSFVTAFLRLVARSSGKTASTRGPPSIKNDLRFLRINMAKIVLQRFVGNFRQRPANSRPVAPAPTMTKVSHARTSSRLAARSARSKA